MTTALVPSRASPGSTGWLQYRAITSRMTQLSLIHILFDFFKAVRETAASRTGAAAARRSRPELIHLKFEIDRTKCAIDAARNHFEQAVDPTLIDCYIYELNAAQLRYQFLLRKFKSQED